MGEVVSIGKAETIVDFLRREGVCNTLNVAHRFGLFERDARRELDALYKRGLIDRRVESASYQGPGGCGVRRYVWFVTD